MKKTILILAAIVAAGAVRGNALDLSGVNLSSLQELEEVKLMAAPEIGAPQTAVIPDQSAAVGPPPLALGDVEVVAAGHRAPKMLPLENVNKLKMAADPFAIVGAVISVVNVVNSAMQQGTIANNPIPFYNLLPIVEIQETGNAKVIQKIEEARLLNNWKPGALKITVPVRDNTLGISGGWYNFVFYLSYYYNGELCRGACQGKYLAYVNPDRAEAEETADFLSGTWRLDSGTFSFSPALEYSDPLNPVAKIVLDLDVTRKFFSILTAFHMYPRVTIYLDGNGKVSFTSNLESVQVQERVSQ